MTYLRGFYISVKFVPMNFRTKQKNTDKSVLYVAERKRFELLSGY